MLKHLFKANMLLSVIAVLTLSCKKDIPENDKKPEIPETQKETTYFLEASTTGIAEYEGKENIVYSVKSTKKVKDKEEFMPWTMEFSTDNGKTWKQEKPEFLTLTVQENSGNLEFKNYKAAFKPQKKSLQTSDMILKARPEKSNLDLSTVDVHGKAHGKGTTTANCYVIHNPGTYKFPTIYGNAMKKGNKNESAFKSLYNTGNILKNFIKADGTAITKPEIEGIKDACLIWQDTKDLISDIKFADNYVSFVIKKETIHNGNAIIAVRDNNGEILWSWHIWVTDRDLTPVEVTNSQNKTYKFMPVNLGWCGLGNEWYASREVKVRVKQQGGKSVELTFKQNEFIVRNDYDIKHGNNPYYQWGRKDPMLPGEEDKDKNCFTNEDKYKFAIGDKGLNSSEIKEYIKNPHKFNTSQDMDRKYYNLWSADNEKTDGNDNIVVKTVYDPSPVGYTIPASNAYTGFTTTGKEANNPNEFNIEGNYDNGYYFYTKSGKTGDKLFFYSSGYRSNHGYCVNSSNNGFIFTAGPKTIFSAYMFSFNEHTIDPTRTNSKNLGCSVRCVTEQ